MSNDKDLTIVEGGGVATAQGFQAGGVFAGIKTPGEDKYDLGMLYSDRECAVAGTFTQNSIVSPSVTVSKDVVARGSARAVIANSGCANCSVGEQGLVDAREVASRSRPANLAPMLTKSSLPQRVSSGLNFR